MGNAGSISDSQKHRKLLLMNTLFTAPVKDLGLVQPELAGIYTLEPEIGAERTGITRQFLEDAITHHTRYANEAHFTKLFRLAFTKTGYKPKPNQLILDLGSGSGANSVLPCLRLFKHSTIVATDLSPDLLRILRDNLTRKSLDGGVILLVLDAVKNYFRPSSFDVVTGASVLHHLIDPEAALRSTYRALRPGGTAFFIEPFEGCALVRIAFQQILESERSLGIRLDERIKEHLKAIIQDFRVRAGRDKSAELYKLIDDKWLFTRKYFEEVAARVGFESVDIVPITSSATQYHDFVQGLLAVSGNSELGLPELAWKIVDTFDSLSPDMKWDVPLEGIIALRKAGSAPSDNHGFLRNLLSFVDRKDVR